MIEWSVKPFEFDIKYLLRGAIKSQSLPDFSAELIMEGPGDLLLEQALQFGYKATNNQAEYEALLATLNLSYDTGAREVICKSDSQVMVSHIKGEFEVK